MPPDDLDADLIWLLDEFAALDGQVEAEFGPSADPDADLRRATAIIERVRSLRGVVQAVEALHQPGESIIVWVYDPNGTEPVSTRPGSRCNGCSESAAGLHDHLVEWPCATYLAVHPDAALAAAADAPQPAHRVEWPHPADPHGATPDQVHQSAVDLLGDCVQRLGSHHPLTEHVRLFADAGPSPAVLPEPSENQR